MLSSRICIEFTQRWLSVLKVQRAFENSQLCFPVCSPLRYLTKMGCALKRTWPRTAVAEEEEHIFAKTLLLCAVHALSGSLVIIWHAQTHALGDSATPLPSSSGSCSQADAPIVRFVCSSSRALCVGWRMETENTQECFKDLCKKNERDVAWLRHRFLPLSDDEIFSDCGGMLLMGCLEWEWHGASSTQGTELSWLVPPPWVHGCTQVFVYFGQIRESLLGLQSVWEDTFPNDAVGRFNFHWGSVIWRRQMHLTVFS